MWLHVARAVEALRPCLVVIENVRGLLTSPAGSLATWNSARGVWETTQPSLLCGHLVPYSAPSPISGTTQGGSCFVPLTSEPPIVASGPSSPPGPPSALLKTPTSNIGKNGGSQHPSKRKSGGHGPNLADEVEWLLPTPKASDGIKGSPNQRHGNGDMTLPSGGFAAAHPEGERHRHSWPPAGQGLAPAPVDGSPAAVGGGGPGSRGTEGRWGAYASAIARWENLTRPAPPPTDAAGRLRADFVEWMQGLAPGWVTATSGLGRPAQLTALGNGVVPQQAAHAVQLLEPPFPHCPRCTAP
ncbi:hypothetical protein ACFU93_42095 [Streptomyces sp. NPDC057611]|uniref:hypothetical protein n=1 Tax=Streptomyces sp. NPDC057611 TaxID=3346182 RepID=UPI0036A44605